MDGTSSSGRWRWLAAALIICAAALRLLYLACDCPLDLAPDEAHYWDWSRNLDWSYYSKGPLVAWLIRLSCTLFGTLSVALTGTEALAVRLPAVVCGSLLLVSLYVLTVQTMRREGLACAVVALALTLPMIAAGSSLMTIDAPYTCCWGWALVAAHRAVFRGSWWAWPLTGLLVGAGVLAKYTMAAFLPSLGLFLLASREHRRLLLRPGFWTAAAVAGVCCLPILLWNAQHGWVTVRHVGNLAGLDEHAPRVHWLGPLHFVALQFVVLLGFWFVVWVRAMWAAAPWRGPNALVPKLQFGNEGYLWWMSAPVFAVFLLFGFKTGGGEANWPVTAYLSGLVLSAAWLADEIASARGAYRRFAVGSVAGACVLGVALTFLAHFSTAAWPALTRLSGPPTEVHPLPLRRLDPTCRLRGWRALAAEVDRVRGRLAAEGVEPVLAASGWNLPGEIGFYCARRPTVYSLGPPLGDRRSQYDFWRPNPILDPEAFRGRTFVFVSTGRIGLEHVFESVEPAAEVTHAERGQPVARWYVCVCRNYRGFPAPAAAGRY